jgi:subtilisin family serine protease
MRLRLSTALIVSLVATTILQVPAHSDDRIREAHSNDRIIITYRNGATAQEIQNSQTRVGSRNSKSIYRNSGKRSDLIQVGAGISVESAIAALSADPAVLYAEPDYLLQKSVVPNDPYYTTGSQLWGMYGDATSPSNAFGSQAAEAWAAGYTGSQSVVVGVIDEGIQVTHPDLAANIWVNPGEVSGDGIDNDKNGKIDDINGWDFFSKDATVFDGAANPKVDAHGTHVSGTIGAVGNNGIGVAGVNWNVKIVSAKFLGPAGGSTSDAILAIDYLVNLKKAGVNLVAINNSWGGGGFSQSLADAINRAGDQGIFFVAAAGNGNSAGIGQNNDVTASYPSNYDCTKTAQNTVRSWDCVVAVAAITSSGSRSTFSNYGLTKVDIGAPGSAIVSTVPNSSYASYSGTSMATPHVTGAIALCASVNPTITPEQIRSALLSSAAATTSLSGLTATGGRLDVSALVASCLSPRQSQNPLVISNTALTGIAGTPISLSVTGGSGAIAPTFTATGTNCSITGSNLNASGAATCLVTATNPANDIYSAAVSPSKTFTFSLVQQAALMISNTLLTNRIRTSVALLTSGGTGNGTISFSVSGTGCSISRNSVTATRATSCTVTATKAASGIYAARTSPSVVFRFN